MIPPESQPVFDEVKNDFQAAVDCYLSAILDVGDLVATVFPELGVKCQEHLDRLRARLTFEANEKTLQESRDTLHQIMQSFGGEARRYTQALEQELNQTLGLVTQAEEHRSTRNVDTLEHLVKFVDQIERNAHAGEVVALQSQAIQLRKLVESIDIDTRGTLAQMRDQIREFQRRLREAELLASRDPLTGIANRREFERQIAARIQAKRDFCVLLFDLDSLKNFNDALGHLYGDEILKQVGGRLSSHIRTRDFVCRWGGDEFAVVLDCGLDPALARSQQIAESVNCPYTVSVDGSPVSVEVHVSVGIAEYTPGETAEHLFHRVDASMYRRKSRPSGG